MQLCPLLLSILIKGGDLSLERSFSLLSLYACLYMNLVLTCEGVLVVYVVLLHPFLNYVAAFWMVNDTCHIVYVWTMFVVHARCSFI